MKRKFLSRTFAMISIRNYPLKMTMIIASVEKCSHDPRVISGLEFSHHRQLESAAHDTLTLARIYKETSRFHSAIHSLDISLLLLFLYLRAENRKQKQNAAADLQHAPLDSQHLRTLNYLLPERECEGILSTLFSLLVSMQWIDRRRK